MSWPKVLSDTLNDPSGLGFKFAGGLYSIIVSEKQKTCRMRRSVNLAWGMRAGGSVTFKRPGSSFTKSATLLIKLLRVPINLNAVNNKSEKLETSKQATEPCILQRTV